MLSLPQQKLIRFLNEGDKKQRYGSVQLTGIIKDGEPLLKTMRVVRMKRRKYKIPTVDSRTI